MYPVMGEKQMSKHVRWDQRVGSKVEPFLKKSERYITSRNGWVSLKGFSGGIYVDVILVHIKTRLDLLGIQTFRWDQTLGRQYSNLNRHVNLLFFCLCFFLCSDGMEREACVCDHRFERSDLCAEIIIIIIVIGTQEKQSQRQYGTSSSMVL